MKEDFFIRIPMEEECDLNAQFLYIILREQLFFRKILYLPLFYPYYMNCFESYLKSLFSSTLSCLSSSTFQEESNKPNLKRHTCLNNLQHSPEWQNHRKEEQICFKIFAAFLRMKRRKKEELLIKKNDSIILSDKNIK